MAFTAGELTNIANATMDHYFNRGDTIKQAVAQKPLVAAMERKAKTFPGGKGDIIVTVKGEYGDGSGDDVLKGFTHDTSVGFYTPANVEQARYPWRETHVGLTMTYTELLHDGISVVDNSLANTVKHSRRELTSIVGLLEDKLEDLGEVYLRGLDNMFHGDGTADALGFVGIGAYIAANPTVGTVGGLNAATKTWWRNRAATAAHAGAGGQGAITSASTSGGVLAQFLTKEYMQLRKYGGKPDLFIAGIDFIDALQIEMRANGLYSQSGFTGGGDVAMGDVMFKGMKIVHDPWLDDNSLAKRGYLIDTSAIFLNKLEGEWKRMHSPDRPADKFVVYRSLTSHGQVCCSRRNSSLVVDIT